MLVHCNTLFMFVAIKNVIKISPNISADQKLPYLIILIEALICGEKIIG